MFVHFYKTTLTNEEILICIFAVRRVGSDFFCCDDDDPALEAPIITVPGTAVAVSTDASVDITFTLDVPGRFQSSSVSADVGNTVISSQPSAGATSGTLVVTYTAPSSEGIATVSLTVTDDSGASSTNTAAEKLMSR
ncbi:MAG: hypothetical protein OER04_10735 [Cyclobacteriaceae bacterium]|nr:hypothetical protein [Cyclobacteriaceae bacterium]